MNMIDENYLNDTNKDKICLLGTVILDKDNLNTLVGYDAPESDMIFYQTEPIVENHWVNKDGIVKFLKEHNFYEIWDYDIQNVHYLRSMGLDAKFKPILYTKAYEIPNNDREKDIDLLFYGSLSEPRIRFLAELYNGTSYETEYIQTWGDCVSMVLYNVDDHRLDEMITRSKVVLDLHNSGENYSVQRQTRISYLLANKCCVLSQKSNVNYYGDCILEFETPQQLLNILLPLLKSGEWKERGNYAYYKFKHEKNLFKKIWGVDE